MDTLGGQLLNITAVSAIVSWILSQIKAKGLLTNIKWVKKAIAAFAAALSTAGITYVYSDHQLIISNITATTGLVFLWTWFKVFVVQQGIYRSFIEGREG